MVETVEVKTFKSQLLDGQYLVSKNLILLNEKLSQHERTETLKHELAHWRFYNQTRIGRSLRIFHNQLVFEAWAVLWIALWFVSPLGYLVACAPFFIENIHEIAVSLKFPSRHSLIMSLGFNFLFLALFIARCVMPF